MHSFTALAQEVPHVGAPASLAYFLGALVCAAGCVASKVAGK